MKKDICHLPNKKAEKIWTMYKYPYYKKILIIIITNLQSVRNITSFIMFRYLFLALAWHNHIIPMKKKKRQKDGKWLKWVYIKQLITSVIAMITHYVQSFTHIYTQCDQKGKIRSGSNKIRQNYSVIIFYMVFLLSFIHILISNVPLEIHSIPLRSFTLVSIECHHQTGKSNHQRLHPRYQLQFTHTCPMPKLVSLLVTGTHSFKITDEWGILTFLTQWYE